MGRSVVGDGWGWESGHLGGGRSEIGEQPAHEVTYLTAVTAGARAGTGAPAARPRHHGRLHALVCRVGELCARDR